MAVCGQHGGGHTVRQRDGFKLSPQEAGALSGMARRLKRDGRVDLSRFPASLPWLQERVERLREQPALVDLQEDILRLTALRDLVLSEHLDIEISELIRLVTAIVLAKAHAVRTRHSIELRNMVPIEQVRETIYALTGILNRYVPRELHPQVERELRTLGARQPDATSDPGFANIFRRYNLGDTETLRERLTRANTWVRGLPKRRPVVPLRGVAAPRSPTPGGTAAAQLRPRHDPRST